MSGYELIAESYRKAAAEFKVSADEAESKARVYDFLASCTAGDIDTLFDSGAFNEIAKNYTRLAMQQANIDEVSQEKVINAMRVIFSNMAAGETK